MATQTTYGLIKRRHVSLQTDIRVAVTSTGTHTEFETDCLPVNLNESMDLISSLESTESEWIPQEEVDMTENDENNNPHDITVPPQNHQSRKFVVFEERLDQLLNQCVACGQKCVNNKTVVGSMLSVSRICVCGESFTWKSQPLIGSMSVGNLVLSAAILISGNSIVQNLMMFNHANIVCFSERTFHNVQQSYLDALFDNIRRDNTGVDARCCSPGHTTKYGSYSLMDLERQQILDVKLVQIMPSN
ncbi:uncharacterized protein LOC130048201 [Ostrea edulis]|uniref:uncharacterized protein LOC130048201 n=1 Tax=Ostrea edulis TaxID=37623 RepID=UPI0024AF22B1|nr:uncharacterized protein LOC130048201 [Ostrea edulis]